MSEVSRKRTAKNVIDEDDESSDEESMKKSNSPSSASDSDVSDDESEAEFEAKPLSKKRDRASPLSEDSETEEIDMTGLTEIEKEKLLLEKYDKEERLAKERELQKKLEASMVENDSRQTRGRKRETEKRKEALSDLKRQKLSNQDGSLLSRLGHDDDDDDEFSDHEEASGMSKDRLEVRRKRRALNKGTKETDEDIYEDEEEEKMGKKDKEEEDETPPVSFAQAGHYLYRRRKFIEDHYFAPYFEDVIKGNYVRVMIGQHDGVNVYRFCEIMHLCKYPTEYRFLGEMTRKGMMLRFGASKKAWKLDCASNGPLSLDEFNQWTHQMNRDNISIPTHLKAKKHKAANDAIISSYTFSNDDINSMVDRKKGAGHVKIKLGVERVRLERELKAAEHDRNHEKAMRIKKQLNELMDEHERRQENKTAPVARLNKINDHVRQLNQKKDYNAAVRKKEEEENMTISERLQYVRSKAKVMFMSKEKIEELVGEGKLVRHVDGSITTLNKSSHVECLPDELNKSYVSPLKLKKKNLDEKKKEELIFVDGKPKNKEEMGEVTIKMIDDDGSETIFRPISQVRKEKQSTRSSVDPTDPQRPRTGLSLKDYFARAHAAQN